MSNVPSSTVNNGSSDMKGWPVFAAFTEPSFEELEANFLADNYRPWLDRQDFYTSSESAVESVEQMARNSVFVPDFKYLHLGPAKNIQVAAATIAFVPSSLSCPVSGCHWTRTTPDPSQLGRHVASHTRDYNLQQEPWRVCCGVPWEQAQREGLEYNEKPRVFGSREMVGGCWRLFQSEEDYRNHFHLRALQGLPLCQAQNGRRSFLY